MRLVRFFIIEFCVAKRKLCDALESSTGVTLKDEDYLHEPVERGEALDAESLGDLLVLGGIDLGKRNGRVVLGEDLGGLSKLGLKLLAVTAPRGVELNENSLVLGNDVVEVVIGEDEDTVSELRLGGEYSRSGDGHKEANLLQHFSLYLLNWI